ncbi:hypothetical protein BGW36DRAFT_345253 [Talaromyces proteolyticus]|uniref:Eisosome protein 1 n=1 Tax=Talaromyces proteolyticus TaxID=1131652 RepID=A0AAD4PVJ6_9EURO|nr:uncharacterized protein BGW36DRAFT_345253 [Talaromyces proteolyticus]KAH8693592.1 hypothetical protein BGW36DRAFT_345253 [Talaromyces proteolyticus]
MTAVRSNAADTNAARLADHAATAALYATDPERRRAADEALEAEQRNEAATLPPGLTLANASAAASLAHARQKTSDPWRPERQPHAERAAFLARGYQAPEPPSTTKINPDVYKAALLAAKERVNLKSPPPATTESPHPGQSAASHIMANGSRGVQETTVVTINPGALNAASGAVLNRRRTESAPTRPVFHPDAAYALTAATISHRASRVPEDVLSDLDPALEAARIHHIARSNVQLYTSTPPVEIEVEEQKHRDTLRAAAISMAKDMYASAAATKGERDVAETAGSVAHLRHSRRLSQSQLSWISGDEQNVTRRPTNLHEAAQKIANEKLSKMQQNDLVNKQQYYGIPNHRSRNTLTRRLRRRTSSDGDASKIDWERSEEIRNQMSSLQSRLQTIDNKKSKDRSDLMEIARKNVNARIHDMDERVYARTGKPSPNMQREWEEKAQVRAKAESDARMTNFGRISVGGQKYMDESEIEAIARARIEPTLNEISDRVEEKRAKEVEQRLDQERSQHLAELDQQRRAEIQTEEKQKNAFDKDKQRLERKHSRRGSMKLLARTSRIFLGRKAPEEEDEKKGADGVPQESEQSPTTASDRPERIDEIETAPPAEPERPETPVADTTQPPHDREDTAPTVTGVAETPAQKDTAANAQGDSPKSESKLKSWFKAKVRRTSKPQLVEKKAESESRDTDTGNAPAVASSAAADSQRAAPLSSNPVTDRDIASTTSNASPDDQDAIRQWSTSTAASAAVGENRPEADGKRKGIRMSLKDMISRKTPSETGSTTVSPLASPTTPTASGNLGTVAMSRPSASRLNTVERGELRDSFTEGSLPPPPTLFSSPGRRSVSSSARDSRFSEDI